MAHWLSVFLLGISTNLDNMLLGVSFGLRRKTISVWANLVIGVLSAGATWLVCLLSARLAGGDRTFNFAGGALILVVGICALLPGKGGEETASVQTRLSWWSAVALGLGLAVNCVPVAFGAGLTGLTPWAAAVSVGALSVLSVAAGNRLGLGASAQLRLSEGLLNALSGGLLIVLGILEFFI